MKSSPCCARSAVASRAVDDRIGVIVLHQVRVHGLLPGVYPSASLQTTVLLSLPV